MRRAARWAIVTSDHVRHRHFANVLADHPAVHALVIEPKSRNPLDNHGGRADEAILLARYFAAREASEASILVEGGSWRLARDLEVVEATQGSINDGAVVTQLVGRGISHCLVFGASWLKGSWFGAFPDRLFNLHLGLSPYYRGVGTNFWPLHDGLPEYVGATVHRLDAGIDTGPILFHVRPEPAVDDDAHAMGNKTIAKATCALRERLDDLAVMPITPQWAGEDASRIFRAKAFNARALATMLDRLERGMIADYVRNLAERAQRVGLVEEYQPITQSAP